jgi:hypothetical protein
MTFEVVCYVAVGFGIASIVAELTFLQMQRNHLKKKEELMGRCVEILSFWGREFKNKR